MPYLGSSNRIILIGLALLGLSVSSVNAAMLYDESISGDTNPYFNSPLDIGTVASGDYVLGSASWSGASDWDGWLFTLDGSTDQIVFEVLDGFKNNGWQLYPSPFNAVPTGTDMDNLAVDHIWESSGLLGMYILGNDDFNSASDYSYSITFVSAVPIPAAVWLFGAALVGLVGFSKRRKAF